MLLLPAEICWNFCLVVVYCDIMSVGVVLLVDGVCRCPCVNSQKLKLSQKSDNPKRQSVFCSIVSNLFIKIVSFPYIGS